MILVVSGSPPSLVLCLVSVTLSPFLCVVRFSDRVLSTLMEHSSEWSDRLSLSGSGRASSGTRWFQGGLLQSNRCDPVVGPGAAVSQS